MYSPDNPKRKRLISQVQEWNMNRLDLFEISEPNEYLEYYGVMRFFFQGDDLKYQSKCLRVSSTATTQDLIDALVMKFHPDMRMLSNDRYALYECHNLQERKLKENEHPLIVQLNWATDDRDGKFILKNESRRRRSTDYYRQVAATMNLMNMTNHALLSNYGMSKSASALTNGHDYPTLRSQSSVAYSNGRRSSKPDNENGGGGAVTNFMRRISASTKRTRKKSGSTSSNHVNHKSRGSIGGHDQLMQNDREATQRMADELSGKPPDSSFTRTISNPDEVMKRRREKKLQSRLEQFSGIKGNDETGGTLKIYGDSINPDIPYKTLLLSVNDTADKVLAETLDKYGLGQEDQRCYVLIQQNIPSKENRQRNEIPHEIILHDQDCPLGILVKCPPKHGYATFAIRHRNPSDRYPSEPRVPPNTITIMSKSAKQDNRASYNKRDYRKDNNQHEDPEDYDDDNDLDDEMDGDEMNHSMNYPINVNRFQDYPRLVMYFPDEDGNMHEDKNEVYSLSALVQPENNRHSTNEAVKFIKIGTQQSTIGGPPNILIPNDIYPDIRPGHCHISAKRDPVNNKNNEGTIRLQIMPTLDTTARVPKPCLVYINETKIEAGTRLHHEDYIQLGDFLMFKFEEFENEDNTVGSTSGNMLLEHMREQGTVESIQMDYLTADLPISIQYDYKNTQKIIDRIFTETHRYIDHYSPELFGNQNNESDLDATFRIQTAYNLYLVIRAGLGEEKHAVMAMDLISNNMNQAIHKVKNEVEKQIYWLSNASELLHLIQCDNDLRNHNGQSQDLLINIVEQSFSYIQNQFCQDLLHLLPHFLQEDDSDMNDDVSDDSSPCLDRASILAPNEIVYPIQHLLQTLSLAHMLFGNCQLNVALSIQMFSQLFHLINSWLFNTVLGDSDMIIVPITQEWGYRLKRRLNRIREWSQNNGLEMAANCHMEKMYQVADLMASDKSDLASFGQKCMDLMNINTSQLNHLLCNCADFDLPEGWIKVIISSASQLHDKAFNQDSNSYHRNNSQAMLYEDLDLRLPLLLPADGYCCDRNIISSTPNYLMDLLIILHKKYNTLYRINPPTTDGQIGDTRWRSYLGNYENTPSVSRSGTLIDQVPASVNKYDQYSSPTVSQTGIQPQQQQQQPQQQLPRNKVIHKPNVSKNNQDYIHHSDLSDQSSESSQLHSEEIHPESVSIQKDHNDSIMKYDLNNRYRVKLKKINNSLGLSIIAVKARPRDPYKIYIKDVIPNGAGEKCGEIAAGDQLVSVDKILLENINQEEAVNLMKKTKQTVLLVMERDAARRNGVLEILNQSRSSRPTTSRTRGSKTVVNNKPAHSGSQKVRSPKEEVPEPEKKASSSRLNYTLPPLPTHEKALPSRPIKTDDKAKSQSKRPQRPLPQKSTNYPLQKVSVTSTNPEYNSLPIRKQHYNKQTAAEQLKYSSVSSKNQPSSKPTRPSGYSSSQPDLTKVIKTLPSTNPKTTISDTNSTSGSSSGSYTDSESSDDSSTSTEKVTVPTKQPDRIKLLAKTPSQPSQTSQPPQLPPPPMMKAKSSNHSIPEPIPKKHTAGKGRFLGRPELAVDHKETVPLIPERKQNIPKEESKMPKLKPKLKPKSPPSSSSASSESESESDSGSSYTHSTPSDHSPKPHVKSSPSMPRPPQSPPVHVNEAPIKLSRLLPKEPIKDYPTYKPEVISSDERSPTPPIPIKAEVQQKQAHSPQSNPPILPHKLPPTSFIPPPRPTASHPQYHPPSQLEENFSFDTYPTPIQITNNINSSINNNNKSQNTEIKLRRKAVEDQIRRETEDNIRISETQQSPIYTNPSPKHVTSPNRRSESDLNNKIVTSNNLSLYGRPKFDENAFAPRPVSLYHSSAGRNLEEPYISSNVEISPMSPMQGVVVPATPPSNVIGTHEVYKESHIRKLEPKTTRLDEPVESLSFRDKMKMFAQKSGEEEVIQRNRFSSKQRRIESGIYN